MALNAMFQLMIDWTHCQIALERYTNTISIGIPTPRRRLSLSELIYRESLPSLSANSRFYQNHICSMMTLRNRWAADLRINVEATFFNEANWVPQHPSSEKTSGIFFEFGGNIFPCWLEYPVDFHQSQFLLRRV